MSLTPRPDSATVGGSNHLAFFAALGRVAGFALQHSEPLGIQLNSVFLKSVLSQPIGPDDLKEADPALYESLVVSLRQCSTEDLAALELTFEVDESSDVLGAKQAIELKEGGAGIAVTSENLEEYLSLVVQHRLVKSIRQQTAAFSNGLCTALPVWIHSRVSSCCSAADFTQILCGAPEIDVAEWRRETKYGGDLNNESDLVTWFWECVEGMKSDERAAVLRFCTGLLRPPSLGFSELIGFNGAPHRFTITGSNCDPDQLPTAATCFNTLRLPPYPTAEVLKSKLRLAVLCESVFDERGAALPQEEPVDDDGLIVSDTDLSQFDEQEWIQYSSSDDEGDYNEALPQEEPVDDDGLIVSDADLSQFDEQEWVQYSSSEDEGDYDEALSQEEPVGVDALIVSDADLSQSDEQDSPCDWEQKSSSDEELSDEHNEMEPIT